MFRNKFPRIALVLTVTVLSALAATVFVTAANSTPVTAADDCQVFPETGFSVCGRFLTYWRGHGGLEQQGYPISNVFEEQNQPPPAGDGKIHRVQYFQRARFEEHTENQPPYDVLLGLLGAEQYNAKTVKPAQPGTQALVLRSKRNATAIGDYYKPAAGTTFLIVDVLVTNVTDKKVSVNPAAFKIKTSATYEYDWISATLSLNKSLKLGDLNPGESTGGEIAFEIPLNETPTSISWNYYTNKVTIPIN